MKSIAIFCGSKAGNQPVFVQIAQQVGTFLAQKNMTLVYGGGRSGLMGTVADSALQAGGQVIGVIPTALVDKELAHPNLTELHVVKNMHERKTKMSELSDGFIALPGGAGTLEEIFEQWTWAQLGIHAKPCGFLNVNGFYDPLLEMVERTVATGFTQSRFSNALQVSDNIETLFSLFERYASPEPKWGVTDVVP
ncbi:TIGR00730 family Rossman fold protein [Acinetobacter sp. MD2(2019)]|uniref:LOG family protein n=1 Tax=Acinetobacter sp. MD2(2019) TaxID=2605273 RepID=UPI002D1E5B04|nr:TIGR00730 family Rossman fold protein [Acinetobacter sp. MD2(2019)]MEB3754677.1 TIGR00730 family Rossman fold protein [Acinetobacter sp. MD2(2019)]